MRCARSLLLISLATIVISTDKGVAQSLFPFRIPFPSAASFPFPRRPFASFSRHALAVAGNIDLSAA